MLAEAAASLRSVETPPHRSHPPVLVTEGDLALLTDLYELTMLEAYLEERLVEEATFSLFFRRTPKRSYGIACGLADALSALEQIDFSGAALAWLGETFGLSERTLAWLASFRFTGDVWAMPEGTPVFPNEPLLEVVAPLPEAQLVETLLLNQLHLQTLLASKAARVVEAAGGRPVLDFGLRRMHGFDAGLKSARAFYVAGVAGTSNVLAGRRYGIPVGGTMAHSYIEAHDDERAALAAFSRIWPETVLLVDTYDTLEGVRRVIELAAQRGEGFRVRGVRLDSGDLGELARHTRTLLDEAGLQEVQIIVSGGLDEWQVRELVRSGAPVDVFGVGTAMGVSDDAPSLDLAYKLTAYAGVGRMKVASGKSTLPGKKQVFRQEEEGVAVRDVISRADEEHAGRPLLVKVMEGGRRLPAADAALEASRALCARERARLPERLKRLEPADPPFPVDVSGPLAEEQREVLRRLAR